MGDNNQIDIGEIFKSHIKIEPQVMAVESLFANKKRFDRTNYKPSYQRNYVWNDEKATYFIESILLGTEIPPLIFFNSGDIREVIDGRQRYETIYRFVNNHFKLKKAGLLIFKDLANKSFSDLKELKDIIWETKLRIIEFSFHTKPKNDFDIEDKVKKEIFKRYNTGITPLKGTDIDKAVYIDDGLNSYIKKTLNDDRLLYEFIIELFSFDNDNIELVLKKIRQLLVQHKIPISYYATEKQEIINKFYELLTDELEAEDSIYDEIKKIFNAFISKINYISEIKAELVSIGVSTPVCKLIVECLFWALSVLENEEIDILKYKNSGFTDKLVSFLQNNIAAFKTDRSSFNSQIFERYNTTSKFFEDEFGLNLQNYVRNNDDFKKLNRGLSKAKTDSDALSKFESLRLNKPDAVSYSIEDICRQMTKQRFLVRPIYQRTEVINKLKSSAIIESIVLGIKLPPIFIFKREDGVSEVIDGQQRILSIIGFLGKDYLDENKKIAKSDKNNFELSLKRGILRELDKESFNTLEKSIQNKIEDYNLWIVEISQKNNPHFDPVDLYIRLNNKPYPIKENTFEMWNSYISREIIETIKSIHRNNKDWFYLRKNNSRMEDENVYTALIYLQYYALDRSKVVAYNYENLGIFKLGDKISFRVKAKNEISRVLEDSNTQDSIVYAANNFEFSFLNKLKLLLTDADDSSSANLNKNLDNIFNVQKGKRTQQSFYALWYFLYEIPLTSILEYAAEIRTSLKQLFVLMTNVDSKQYFDEKVEEFRTNFGQYLRLDHEITTVDSELVLAKMGEVTNIFIGLNGQSLVKVNSNSSSADKYPFVKKATIVSNSISNLEVEYVLIEDKVEFKDFLDFRDRIIIHRLSDNDRFSIAYTSEKALLNSEFITISPIRAGLSTKFVFGILSSKYAHFVYRQHSTFDPGAKVSVKISAIKEIPVPIVKFGDQITLITIVEYILFLESSNADTTFFNRLKDAFVYELFIPSIIKEAGCEVIEHLSELKSIKGFDEEKCRQIIEQQYKDLTSPSSLVNASLLKLLNVRQIALIEGRL